MNRLDSENSFVRPRYGRAALSRHTGFALAALLGTASLPTIAHAQAVAPSPVPVRQMIDANGVDLFAGTFNYSAPALSIGHGDAAMTYTMRWAGNGWTNEYNIYLYQNGSTLTVSLGGQSDSFTVSGSTYTPTEGNGSTLSFNSSTNVYTYVRADGTVIHFNKTFGRRISDTFNEGLASDITDPSGATITFSYTTIQPCATWKILESGDVCTSRYTLSRLASAANAYGYQVSFGYATDDYDDSIGVDNSRWSAPTGISVSNTATAALGLARAPLSQSFSGGFRFDTISDPLGYATQFRTDGAKLFGIKTPGSASENVTIGYAGDRVSSVTTPAGTVSYGASDANGARTVTATDGLNHTTTYVFDIASRRLTSMRDPLGNTTSYGYDASGRLQQVTRPEGDHTHYAYDGRGNLTETRIVAKPGANPPADIVTTAAFPESCTTANAAYCNKPTTTTDARGAVTHYGYNQTTGQVTSVTLPAVNNVSPQTRYSYTNVNGVSLLTGISTCQTASSCTGTADEVKVSITYDLNKQPVSVGVGAGDNSLTATTSTSYDMRGNPIAVDGPLAGGADTTVMTYDAARQLLVTISPDPDGNGPLRSRATSRGYDPDGRMTNLTQGTANADGSGFAGLQQINTSYDNAGRKLTESLSASGTTYSLTQYSYDAASRLDCVAVRMNPSAFGSLPASACTAGTVGSFGPDRIAKYGYDEANRQTSITTAYGTTAAQTVSASWTPNGRQGSLTDGKGNVTTFAYDRFDRLFQTHYPNKTGGGSSATDYEELTYDANSNVTGHRMRNGNPIAYFYDALNRLTTKNLPTGNANLNPTFTYDNLGRLKTANNANGVYNTTTSFAYDALGRKISETSGLNGANLTKTMGYDLAGHRTRLAWPDNFAVIYDYNVAGDMTAIREDGAVVPGAIVLATFGYDDLGRRTSLTRGNGTTTSYEYDPASRLTLLKQDMPGDGWDQEQRFTSYNPAGQIVQQTRSNDLYAYTGTTNGTTNYTTNGLNQYTPPAGSSVPSYDPRGNLTGLGSATFSYSAENELAQINGTDRFYYDALHRLVYSTGVSARSDRDGDDLIAMYDASGNLLRRFMFGPNMDEPLVWYNGTGTTDRRWLHADERGSITAITNAGGGVLSINTYDEYGNPGANNQGRFQFTGQTWQPEVGMYYYKSRMYVPSLGRFAQTDPIGYAAGPNLYNYVGSDPVNLVDPLGLQDTSLPTNCSGDICNAPDNPPTPPNYDVWGVPSVASGSVTNHSIGSATGNSGGGAGTRRKNQPVKRIDCNSKARQFSEFGNRLALTAGGSAILFGTLGAEPVAGIFGGAALVGDGISFVAGGYIYLTEGDSGPLKSSFIGAAAGAVGRLGVGVLGTRVTMPAPGVRVTKVPGNTQLDAAEFASGQAGGAQPAQVCR